MAERTKNMSKTITNRQWETTDKGSIGRCIEKTTDALILDASANGISEYEICDNGNHEYPCDGLMTVYGGTVWIKRI